MDGNSILARMLTQSAAEQEPDPAANGLAGVLAKSASVSGLDELEIQLEADSRQARQTEPVEFISQMGENSLFFQIECGVDEQIGLMSIDQALINAIDDVLTGELDEKLGEASARRPTAIDIALCRPYFDAIFLEFAAILQELRAGKPTDTYATGPILHDPSPHQFPDIPYVELALEFDFANGARKGGLSLMLPSINTAFTSALPRPGESPSSWKSSFDSAVREAPTSLDVVLYRKQMPIGDIMRLKTGDMLDIPARALESLSIESVDGRGRRGLMRARLGEYQEMRAAKITQIGEHSSTAEQTRLLSTTPDE